MKTIKKLLYKILGLKSYLQVVSRIYIKYIQLGFGKKKYSELHYLKDIVKPGFICIDIGANVGYYSFFMSKLCGEKGKLFAIEPIPVFAEVWKKNVSNSKINNITLYQCALGGENKNVKMGMPMIDGVVHHGMTRIVSVEDSSYEKLFDVQMRIPDELFKDLDKIDFIKVDIEGYENIAFENMKATLSRHKPLIQSELSGKGNREKTIKILSEISYVPHVLINNKLVEISSNDIESYNNDFYFKIKK